MATGEEIYMDLPTPETERLVLRRLKAGDAKDLFEYASEPKVSHYVP
ncbi:GNAT family N-acetyltransferase [Virgibacillus phasianinus]|nr:hypothetical protein [Virgibacillus phasianinus]